MLHVPGMIDPSTRRSKGTLTEHGVERRYVACCVWPNAGACLILGRICCQAGSGRLRCEGVGGRPLLGLPTRMAIEASRAWVRGAGASRLAQPPLPADSADDGWAARACLRIRAELRSRHDRSVGRCGARFGHCVRRVRARHGAAIALLGSCVARLCFAAIFVPVCRARSAGAGLRPSRVADPYGGVHRRPALVVRGPGSPLGSF